MNAFVVSGPGTRITCAATSLTKHNHRTVVSAFRVRSAAVWLHLVVFVWCSLYRFGDERVEGVAAFFAVIGDPDLTAIRDRPHLMILDALISVSRKLIGQSPAVTTSGIYATAR
jgi:hypothetical protein